MFKFIKLTEVLSRGDTKLLLLNVAYISHVQSGMGEKSDTHVRMANANVNGESKMGYYFVRETVEQIEEMINTDHTRPPIVMSAEEYAKAMMI